MAALRIPCSADLRRAKPQAFSFSSFCSTYTFSIYIPVHKGVHMTNVQLSTVSANNNFIGCLPFILRCSRRKCHCLNTYIFS